MEIASAYEGQELKGFIRDVETRLRALEQTGVLEVNQLIQKESFLGLLITACEVARRTRRKEKVQRIKSALLFCALHNPRPDEVDSFFHLLDQLTEEHFVVLAVLSQNLDAFVDVKKFAELFAIFAKFCPNMPEDVFGHYLYDLNSRRLIRLSPTIEDEAGLEAHDHIVTSGAAPGAKIIISAVAQQLLHATKD